MYFCMNCCLCYLWNIIYIYSILDVVYFFCMNIVMMKSIPYYSTHNCATKTSPLTIRNWYKWINLFQANSFLVLYRSECIILPHTSPIKNFYVVGKVLRLMNQSHDIKHLHIKTKLCRHLKLIWVYLVSMKIDHWWWGKMFYLNNLWRSNRCMQLYRTTISY